MNPSPMRVFKMPNKSVRFVTFEALTGAGRGVEHFWSAMLKAHPGQAQHSLGDTRLEKPEYVALTERAPDTADAASFWLNVVCEAALNSAKKNIRSEASRLAIFVGSSLGGMTILEALHRHRWDPSGKTGASLQHWSADLCAERGLYDGPATAVGANLLARGGSWALNTACSSAANALGLARRWLLRQRCDIALVAGVDVISPFVFSGFRGLGAIDPQPTSPFSAARAGLNLGEAAIAAVLCRTEDTRDVSQPIDLIGFGSSCDAHHLTRPDLGGAGLVRAIRAALGDANVDASAIDFVSAHATGTPYNDTMEAAAFSTVFGERRPFVHCAKPVTGHTLGAAGIVDALLVWCALQHAVVPKTFSRGPWDKQLGFAPLNDAAPLRADAHVLSTSSGFGGSNAAIVMRRGQAQ